MINLICFLLCFQQSIRCTLADKDAWSGAWFPTNPNKPDISNSNDNDSWSGPWFPRSPFGNGSVISETLRPTKTATETVSAEHNQLTDGDQWKGLWFPASPMSMLSTADCDDAQTNLGIDFDPSNQSHSMVYRCLDDRRLYAPKYQTQPILYTAIVPTAYRPRHRCMNESISYADAIPTFGNHRPIWPKYGEYRYVPPQRWLHSLEHGAIVMLHHPCAEPSQVSRLRNIVTACVYRHIITTNEALSPERPLALVSWGHRLEMSAVSAELASEFIRLHSGRGPEVNSTTADGHYDHLLLRPSVNAPNRATTTLCPTNIANK